MIDLIEIDDIRWLNLVEQHPESNIFHHPNWSNTIAQTYGYTPFVLVWKQSDNTIAAGLPMMKIKSWFTGKRCVALPFTDHCWPLLNHDMDFEFIKRGIENQGEKLSVPRIEIRYNPDHHESPYYLHLLRLDKDPENLFQKFRKKGVKYCIKKAAKSGVIVERCEDPASMRAFYNLHLMTRKKLGVPCQPWKYFLNVWERIINVNMGFVMLAHYNDRPVAAGVFLHYNGTLIYKYGATDPSYMNVYANHLLLWEVIKWACDNGLNTFDWGRTEINNEGLRNFKKGWGTEEERLAYLYLGQPQNQDKNNWKKDLISIVVRNSPVWVASLLGNFLYKHAG